MIMKRLSLVLLFSSISLCIFNLSGQNLYAKGQIATISSPAAAVQSSLPPPLGVKITSHITGQQVPTGELTISGTSTDTSSAQCEVYTDINDLKPMQKVTAKGPSGPSDYSAWTFTYTAGYSLIKNGTNNLTSKISCLDGPTAGNMTKWNSVNLTGVEGMRLGKGQVQQQQQPSVISTLTNGTNNTGLLISQSATFGTLDPTASSTTTTAASDEDNDNLEETNDANDDEIDQDDDDASEEDDAEEENNEPGLASNDDQGDETNEVSSEDDGSQGDETDEDPQTIANIDDTDEDNNQDSDENDDENNGENDEENDNGNNDGDNDDNNDDNNDNNNELLDVDERTDESTYENTQSSNNVNEIEVDENDNLNDNFDDFNDDSAEDMREERETSEDEEGDCDIGDEGFPFCGDGPGKERSDDDDEEDIDGEEEEENDDHCDIGDEGFPFCGNERLD